MSIALEMKDVSHVYVTDADASLAVNKFNLSIPNGQFVSLVGPSGCGKTTVLSMIAGLLQPTEGRIHVYGKPVSQSLGKIGYMLQQDYLFPWRSIRENAVIGLELLQKRNNEAEQYVIRLLQEMGLSDHIDSWLHQLSGGMRQRVALVRTLATEPNLMLLDEPFSALDYQTKLQLEDLVWETLRSKNKTALLVTHDISEAIAMSDKVIVMGRNPGRVCHEIQIPSTIRHTAPFRAREQSGFMDLFHMIWKLMEDVDCEEGEEDETATDFA